MLNRRTFENGYRLTLVSYSVMCFVVEKKRERPKADRYALWTVTNSLYIRYGATYVSVI